MKNRLRQLIVEQAKKLGFDLVGFTGAQIDEKHKKALKSWLKNRYEGRMAYMSESEKIAKRFDLEKILPGAKSVIVLAMNYYHEQKPLTAGFGRIARYAYGRDYHKIISEKLKILEDFIKKIGKEYLPATEILTKAYVDTGPILERALAEQSGIGVIGKNSSLITKEFGSWVLLAEIITNIDLTDELGKRSPSKDNFSACGICTRCKKACPTGALIAPGIIDARRCISYLTIEHKGKIPKKLAKATAKTRRIFGCDICQEVCPHNISRQKPTNHKELTEPKIAGDQLELEKILNIKTDDAFLKLFAGSPLMRAKRKGLQRNANML